MRKYKARVELVTGLKIQRIRTDSGGEYVSAAFCELCHDTGMDRHKSQPYTPQSNGLAECKNRCFVKWQDAYVLHQTELPKHLRSEAIRVACCVHNRRPTKALLHLMPEEVFMKKKPDVAHLRILGTRVYVHVPKNKRDKLDPKTSPCILKLIYSNFVNIPGVSFMYS